MILKIIEARVITIILDQAFVLCAVDTGSVLECHMLTLSIVECDPKNQKERYLNYLAIVWKL